MARVDFNLSDDQLAVTEVVGGALKDLKITDTVGESGYDVESWRVIADSGLLDLVIPERLGGDGLGVAAAATLLTELGTRGLVTPALPTVVGVLPILAAESAVRYDDLLGRVGKGAIVTVALAERGDALPTVPTVRAVADGDELVVSGTKRGVWNAAEADLILVATDAGVVAVDAGTAGVTFIRTPSSSGLAEYSVAFDSARVPAAALLMRSVRDLYRHVVIGATAYADGLLAGAMNLTAAHLASREQFGRPLATFQAVAQQIADVYVTSRTMHLAATAATWRAAEGLDADDDIDVAAYWLAEELPAAFQQCHHLHGGLGVDVTYPLHRYSSTVKDLARLVGGASYRLESLGA